MLFELPISDQLAVNWFEPYLAFEVGAHHVETYGAGAGLIVGLLGLCGLFLTKSQQESSSPVLSPHPAVYSCSP